MKYENVMDDKLNVILRQKRILQFWRIIFLDFFCVMYVQQWEKQKKYNE